MPLKIERNDITKIHADIIVNTAHPKPKYSNGTDMAIYLAAGEEELLLARKEIGDIDIGEIAVTPAFKLNAKYIIHTVGPMWEKGDDVEVKKLYSCYDKSLKKAVELGCESIAFPLISSGCFGFPKDEALQVAINAISRFLLKNDMDVTLVVFDKESFSLSGKLFSSIEEYIDEHYVGKKSDFEYGCGYGAEEHNRRIKESKIVSCASSLAIRNSKIDTIMTWGVKSYKSNDIRFRTGETFQECLFRYADKKGISDVELYKKANIDRKLFSKIRCNTDYKPKKKTAVAFAIALELNLEETKDLLAHAGIALSSNSIFDQIIEFCILKQIYDINSVNIILFDYEQPTLGG